MSWSTSNFFGRNHPKKRLYDARCCWFMLLSSGEKNTNMLICVLGKHENLWCPWWSLLYCWTLLTSVWHSQKWSLSSRQLGCQRPNKCTNAGLIGGSFAEKNPGNMGKKPATNSSKSDRRIWPTTSWEFWGPCCYRSPATGAGKISGLFGLPS